MDFDTMINSQYTLGQQIQQLVSNCKKAGRPRRTSQFFADKITQLQTLGEQFHKQHGEILRLEQQNKDDEYFTSHYYEEIRSLVADYTKALEAEARNLESDPNGKAALPTKGLATNHNTEENDLTVYLRKLLRNQKALIQVVLKNTNEIMENPHDGHPTSYYAIKASILEKHMIDLSKNNTAIWDATEKDVIDDYTPQTYYEVEAKVEAAMIELQQHLNLDTAPAQVHHRSIGDQHGAQIPLPRISLPKFSGDYMQWASFKDLFIELVHNAPISNTQRIHYLNNSLTDEARNLVKHLPAIGNNYAAAWEILTHRYDNKRLLVSTLLKTLIAQPIIKPDSAMCLKSLHDVTKECVHGLQAQGLPVQQWDAIIAHLLWMKMDQTTQAAFEQGLSDNKRLITKDEVMEFLEKRFQSLEVRTNSEKTNKRTCGTVTNKEERCPVCKQGNHQVYNCSTFKAENIKKKWQHVKELKLCVNCLRSGHLAAACNSQHCTKCPKKHNTLLHSEIKGQTTQTAGAQGSATSLPIASTADTNSEKASESAASLLVNNSEGITGLVLLGTAMIKLQAASGQLIECRAVLDSGSQVNLITERLQRKLGIQSSKTPLCVEGVGSQETAIRHRANVTLRSRLNGFSAQVDAHIIPKIVSDQPTCSFNADEWNIPKNIPLADPDFAKKGRIDCLLGAGIFFKSLSNGKHILGTHLPVLQNTVFGWVVAGNVENSNPSKAVCGICTSSELDEMIAKFWRTEDLPEGISTLTDDESRCETHFIQNTIKEKDGRFSVKLPLKAHPSTIVDSRGIAYERFKAIERRLSVNSTLKADYVAFMREYERLGHMTEINAKNIPYPRYFIPHHCVLRPESTSTKLRVVFDASARNATEPSLNDIMHTGPTVQSELFSILLRFRMHKYVLTTDIEKMYRQIWVQDQDRNLQLIMWREEPTEPIKIFKLNTVTYGTRAAPYLATRCLMQLAIENQDCFSYGARALKNDFYVDDGLIGADTINEALETQNQLITILNGAGMNLRKWCANDPRLLIGIPQQDQEVDLNFSSEEKQATKTLGLTWLPKQDVFCIKANTLNHASTTKRTMTSDLAHIYDPLGLIAPVVVTGKIQIQKVWQIKLDWDDNLPSDIINEWKAYRDDLTSLDNATFPRHVFGKEEYTTLQLHAFADASEKAYGAAIYIRMVQRNKCIKLNLLCARSRIAPIKAQTIPKLELCAALLATELLARVKMDLNFQNVATFLWTDSQIVLSWINHHPGTLPSYVANRIIKIHKTSDSSQWRHVPSKQNPADIISRGLKPCELMSSTMWFYGPLFLYQDESGWPAPFTRKEEDHKTIAALSTKTMPKEQIWIYDIHSKNSFRFVQKVVGYVLRFIKNTRKPKESRPIQLQLSAMELEAALKIIIRQIQSADFPELKKTLMKEKFVPKTSDFSSLTPFLDEENIIRVGGRISASNQQFDAKHQMILPSDDQLVKLLVEKLHKENYHCGPQALLAIVRQRFWPLKGKSLVRAVVQRCVKCTKSRPTFFKQIMGNLPPSRVQPARPFLNSGVDYCGPFWVHFKTRGKRPQKTYLAVFCCFATKAVHLELVTDLTTDAFVGALKRFIGRRGHCQKLFCDNATNFVGAKNQLKELDDSIYSTEAKEKITNFCSTKGIDFNFIPPRSPHFGGLWEAAVKSAKHLLIKNVSSASLTYEELETVIVEIEAMLNSRPLTPISSDPNDLNALTPGHFLIGEPLLANVDAYAHKPTGKLIHHWKQVSELKHNFWQRWSKEYLNELQQRHKWKGPIQHIELNTLVIIKEDNIPVLQWPLGRIVKIYKGDDGIVRVCDVKTQRGIFQRAIHRLAPLFPENETKEDNPNEETHQHLNSNPASLPVSIPLNRIDTWFLHNDATSAKLPRLNSSLLLTIMTLLFLPIALCNQVNVTRFNNKPGTYFEQLSMVKRMSANWKMIIYFDLGQYQDQINVLHDATVTLQKLCDNATTNVTCDFLLNYLDHATNEIQADISLFNTKRSKRGAIDLVGNFANSLFGVLDSNYAAQMSKTINELKKRDDHMEQLVKNQTSLIDSTINLMKKTQLNIQAKFDEIDTRIHQLLFSNQSTNDIQLQQQILLLSLQTFMVISNLQRIQSSIFDVLIDSQHNKVNPLLLTPQQFTEELLKIKSHLPTNSHLPFHENNIMEAYQIINVKGVIAKQHAIFCIDLPLTDARELQLFHLVPIAAALNNTLSTVELSTRFLALTPHRDEFFPMKQHEVDACLSISENELLCPNIQATYQAATQPVVNKCEIDLLNNLPEPRCKLRRLDDTTVWQQLQNRNQWIFATLNTIKFNAVCGDDTLELTLAGSGLLTLRPDCTIKNDLITIQGQQQIVTSLQLSLSKVNPAIGWVKQFTSNNISVQAFVPTIHEFEEIQNKLAELHAFTSSTEFNNTHTMITSYLAMALIAIAAPIIIYNWKKFRKTGNPNKMSPQDVQITIEDTEC